MSTYRRRRFDVLRTRKKVQFRFVILRSEQCARVVFIIWAQEGRGKYVRTSGHTVLIRVEKKYDKSNEYYRADESAERVCTTTCLIKDLQNRRRSLRTRGVAGDFCGAAVWGEGG